MKTCEQDGCETELTDGHYYCTTCYYKLTNGEMPDEQPEPSQLDRIENLLIGVVAREKLIESKLDKLLEDRE